VSYVTLVHKLTTEKARCVQFANQNYDSTLRFVRFELNEISDGITRALEAKEDHVDHIARGLTPGSGA